jgi:hypothetical protein
MTPIKTYSVWINLAATIVGIAAAVVQFVQAQDPTTPLTVVALGAVTLVARMIPQTEPPKKEPVRVEEKE